MTAHGLVAGADPQLATKALRARAQNIKADQSAMEAGYSPEIRAQFHESSPNPLEGLNIYNDSASKPGLHSIVGGKTPAESPAQELARRRAAAGKR
jgi:hypothetical protein